MTASEPTSSGTTSSVRRRSLIDKVMNSAASLRIKTTTASGKSATSTASTVGPRKRNLGTPNRSPAKKRAKAESPMVPSTAKPLSDERSKAIDLTFVQHDVTSVYQIIHKQTGALGGNGAGGAIYGEITKNSMAKILDYMVDNCELTDQSVFLDIGSGLGKPNFHAAVAPGVAISYGIELEDQRWELSLHNLRSVLSSAAVAKKVRPIIFTRGDITDASSLDPFSHVYSFDVGFPPAVMAHIAECFNDSHESRYFVSFHGPKKVLGQYGFDVEELGRLPTSMAGSSEGHAVYFYRKVLQTTATPPPPPSSSSTPADEIEIDPLFRAGFQVVQQGHDKVTAWIDNHLLLRRNQGRTRRQLLLAKRNEKVPVAATTTTLDQYYRRVRSATGPKIQVK
ncbi:hypothetical protein DYB37_006340 [Aphanomyces astaci]|uniref:Histone-lysine N-methyltransferase, H3 lysine-79 specific n=2 Tax=Aphanomyces astaci TaxID=112090 RepID=A0A3R7CNS7_APHAT|nr:hypothetical protein DYB37_006340 [Aphanomyces astaci]